MNSGDDLGSKTAKPSSSRQVDPEISRNELAQASLYTRVENARRDANSILQETSNWPGDSVTTVKELLETINDGPDLREIPFEPNSTPGGLRDSIEQYALAMEDVRGRLKKTHRKYGSNRKFSDVIKYLFASLLSKEGCSTALRGCHNDIDKALAAVRDRLEDNPVTRKHCRQIEKAKTNPLAIEYPLISQANESPAGSAGNPTHPTNADAGTTPVPQSSGNDTNLLARTSGKAVSIPQQSFNVAETFSVDRVQSEQTTARRRQRLEVARTTFETIEGISGAIPVVGSYVGAGAKVGLAVVNTIQVTETRASCGTLPSDAFPLPTKMMDSNTETAKDLESRTGRLSDLLGHFNKRSSERPQGEVLQQMTQLKSELESVRNKIDELNSQGTLRNAFTSSSQAEALKGYQETIRVALEELQLLISLNTTNLLNELYDTEKRKEQRRLLDRLGDASCGARGNAIEEVVCLPGTRVEVLERIDDWIRNRSSSERVLWIRGMAGRGKSTVASTVAYNWRYRASVAIFHFRRGQKDLDQRLVCALARQLGSSVVPEVKEVILQNILKNEDVGQERLQEQFKLLFVASAERLRDSTHPTLIVVDALDECEDAKYAVGFVDLLHKHASSFPTNFKFLLTTRPETPLLDAFKPRQWLMEDLDGLASIDKDIAELLQRRFSVIREKHGLGEAWPPQAAIRSLVQMSEGLFQWAQTAMEYISEGSPEFRMEELLNSPSLIGSLDNLYAQILSKAYKKAMERPGRAELLLRLLGTLAAASYPLSLEIFIYLSAEQPMFRNKSQQQIIQLLRLEILCDLGSLVFIPNSPNQPMRLVHTSVRDLLVDELRCCAEPYYIDLGQNHRNLTGQCLALMMRNLRENMCKLSDLSKSNAQVQDVVEREVPKGLQYSCRSWSTHLIAGNSTSRAPEAAFEIALSNLKLLSRTKLMYWLEVMSLVGATVDAITTAKRVHIWLQGTPNAIFDPELVAIWNDARRFIASFLEPISFGALHIYASALPFCPTKTKIWEYYSSQALNRVLHGPQELVWALSLWERSAGSNVHAVVFLQDGKVLALGCKDHTIRLWDCETGIQLGEPLTGHSSRVEVLALSPGGKTLASGSVDGAIRLWDAESGNMLGQPLEGHTDLILSLIFSYNDKTLTSVSQDRTVRFWDCETSLSLGPPVVFLPDDSLVWRTALSPDANVLAFIVNDDNTAIQLLDAKNGTPLGGPLTGHSHPVEALAFSPDGKILASGSNGTMILWASETGVPILHVDASPIRFLAFSPDGGILASVDGWNIQFWDVRTGTKCGEYQTNQTISIASLAFSPNGKVLASGSYDQTVKLWDVQGAPALIDLSGDQPTQPWIAAIASSPDGKFIASGGSSRTIQMWDAETGTLLNTLLACHSEPIRALAFSPDGLVFASGSDDKTLCLWDVKTQTLLGAPLTGHTDPVNVVAFSPDGKILASGSDDRTILFWDASSGAPLDALRTCRDSEVYSLAFSPDGRFFASGCIDGAVRLSDAATGAITGSLTEDSGEWPRLMEFVQKGRLIVKYNDNAVALYDVLTLQRCDPDASSAYPAYKSFQEPYRFLTFKGPWISFFSQRLLWVPSQHWVRAWCSQIIICKGRLAFIGDHGELFILDVSRSLSL